MSMTIAICILQADARKSHDLQSRVKIIETSSLLVPSLKQHVISPPPLPPRTMLLMQF